MPKAIGNIISLCSLYKKQINLKSNQLWMSWNMQHDNTMNTCLKNLYFSPFLALVCVNLQFEPILSLWSLNMLNNALLKWKFNVIFCTSFLQLHVYKAGMYVTVYSLHFYNFFKRMFLCTDLIMLFYCMVAGIPGYQMVQEYNLL